LTVRKWLSRGARSTARTAVLMLALGAVSPWLANGAQARDASVGLSGGASVSPAQLPREAAQTLDAIRAGGPFRYSKDGVVFKNFERELPARPRGYYHEYTVTTPRSRDRGARRIVCGGPPRSVDDCYYTGDHYQTFQRILE
jgi:ribonuclease T1